MSTPPPLLNWGIRSAQDSLCLTAWPWTCGIFLLQIPKCWECRCEQSHWADILLKRNRVTPFLCPNWSTVGVTQHPPLPETCLHWLRNIRCSILDQYAHLILVLNMCLISWEYDLFFELILNSETRVSCIMHIPMAETSFSSCNRLVS